MPRVNNINITEGQIAYSNFTGRPTQFKPEGGVRTATFVIPDEIADALINDGWSIREQKFDDGSSRYLLEAKITFRTREGKLRDPKIFIVRPDKLIRVTEETADSLDQADIISVDAVLGPYYWDWGGRHGITAYVNSMYLTIKENPIDEKYQKMVDEINSVVNASSLSETDDLGSLPFPIDT